MPGRDLHSRMVGWLKVVLPLAALVILSTLFLLSDRIDPTEAIPYAKVDVEDLANDPRMSTPAYAGTTEDGAGITLAASAARPAKEDRGASAERVVALMETPDGQKIALSAAAAALDQSAGRLDLAGEVTLETEAGYRLETDAMAARLDRTDVSSSTPVKVTGPMGDIRADSFTLTQDPADPGAYLLVFKGGVRLLYLPGGQTP
mgnify:FL=1